MSCGDQKSELLGDDRCGEQAGFLILEGWLLVVANWLFCASFPG
jgi:hypothetical protein